MFRSARTLFALASLAALPYSAAAADFHCDLAHHEPFLDQANRFILAGLQYQPVEATQAGYHGDANVLDTQLDDSSPETIAAQRKLMLAGKTCFAAVKVASPEDVADLALLRDNINSSLFALDVLQPYHYRPQDYVEMIGSGLFFPLTSTEGTEQARLSAVLSRMEKIPGILDEARHNLKEADPVFIDTALDENTGNLGVLDQIGGMIPTGSPLRARYDAASKAARAALDSYAAWLKDDLAHRPHTVTWRTGPTRLRKDLRLRPWPGHS